MSRTSGWAAALGDGAPPALVEAAVRIAVAAVPLERRRLAVERRLDASAIDIPALFAELSADRRVADLAESVVETTARTLVAAGARVHVVGSPGYPRRLAQAWPELGAPLWVFSRGASLPDLPTVAIVGTRRPTLDGVATARALGRMVARAGGVVVSGMARGIDQAAHRGALDAGGVTGAVLGTGFGVDYPHRDGSVREAIAASGGLWTELVPGTPPRPYQFLERNRIVSGLADATVVVEGHGRSGALHTARLAAAQGREVLACPGPLSAPTSRAPLDLIRDGATPLTRPDDLLEALGLDRAPRPDAPAPSAPSSLSETAQAVVGLLGAVPAAPGALAAATGRPVGAVLAAVAELSAAGVAATTPRGVVARTPS